MVLPLLEQAQVPEVVDAVAHRRDHSRRHLQQPQPVVPDGVKIERLSDSFRCSYENLGGGDHYYTLASDYVLFRSKFLDPVWWLLALNGKRDRSRDICPDAGSRACLNVLQH